ncbi:Hypothetical predicted protein, partial [Pelobates cultripes]
LSRHKKGGYPFGPPTTIIAVTRTAVLTDSQDLWIHASRVKLSKDKDKDKDKGKDKDKDQDRDINQESDHERSGCQIPDCPSDYFLMHLSPDLFDQ